MNQKEVNRNIRLYAWFRILRDPLFWAPILITYIINIGKMSLAELYFMESVVVMGMVFVEIYSSAWADLLGRKKVLILGSLFAVIAIILFSLVYSPLMVWVSNITVMIAFALVSGVDEAYLVDTLKEAGRINEFTKINGRILSMRFALIALCSIVSGYLYSIDPRLPMYLSIPGVLVSFIISFFLSEPKRTEKFGHKEHFNLMKLSILFTLNHKKVKWIIGYISLVIVASKLWFFTYNPYFELVELDPKYFGWIFFALNIVAWGSSRYAYSIEKKLSEAVIIVGMLVLVSVPIMLMGIFVAQAAIAFVFFENLSRGFREPFFSSFINKHLDSKNRATVLSIKSAARALISSFSLWIFGLVLIRYPLALSLQILGISILFLGIISFCRYKVIFRP
jgi:MFS family permease